VVKYIFSFSKLRKRPSFAKNVTEKGQLSKSSQDPPFRCPWLQSPDLVSKTLRHDPDHNKLLWTDNIVESNQLVQLLANRAMTQW